MGISNGSRKLVGISLFIFWAIVTAVLVAGLLFYQNNNNPDNSGSVAGSSLPKNGVKEITLDLQEIAKHSAASDCWMIIDGKVYNFTSYLGVHPGNTISMLPYCGKDGSQAFATKDQNNPKSHSDYAKSLFVNYYIGNLNQTADAQQIQQNIQNTAQITPLPRRGGNDEDDD